jgi:hypothetical protein
MPIPLYERMSKGFENREFETTLGVASPSATTEDCEEIAALFYSPEKSGNRRASLDRVEVVG